MTNPYFSVGEEVIVVVEHGSQHNGDHVIEAILPKGRHELPETGGFHNVTDLFAYKMVGIGYDDVPDEYSGYFKQSSLRKKHKPSDESFTDMITHLNKEPIHEYRRRG